MQMVIRFVLGALVPALVAYGCYFALFETHNKAIASINPSQNMKGWIISDQDRHCMILTILGEATPNSRVEVIGIARNILRRKQMGRWGSTVCQVTLSPKQYSVWNTRSMRRYKYSKKQYQRYSMWVDEALSRGPIKHEQYWHPKTMKKLYGYSNPKWARYCVVKERIGHATFCTLGKKKRKT